MASSGSNTVNITNYLSLQISWRTVSQSIPNNTSRVEATLKLLFSARVSSSQSKQGSITINGNRKNFSFTIGTRSSGSLTLGTHTVTVPHNNNGTKSTTVTGSASINLTLSGSYVGTRSASTTASLNTIPRASTITSVTGSQTLGEPITVNLSRASSSFSHSITMSFAGTDEIMLDKVTGTSLTFTPPVSWANRIPNSNSANGRIWLNTYNGNTKIGAVSQDRVMNVPSGNPILDTSFSHVRGNLPSDFTYTQGISKLEVSGHATAQYGATMRLARIWVNDETFVNNNRTYTTGVLKKAGTNDIIWEYTDSRGRKTRKTETIVVQAYTPPLLTLNNVYRSDSEGNINTDAGEYVNVQLDRQVSTETQGNKLQETVIKYRKLGEETWTSIAVPENENSVIIPNISTDNSYEIIGIISDSIRLYQTNIITIDSAFVLINFHKDGRAIAFGEVAQAEEGMGINMPVNMKDSLYIQDNMFFGNGSALHQFDTGIGRQVIALYSNGIGAGRDENGAIIYLYGNEDTTSLAGALIMHENGEEIIRAHNKKVRIYGGLNVNDFSNTLWSGQQYPTASQTITPSKPLNECLTGWILRWQRYEPGQGTTDTNFLYTHVPKVHGAHKSGSGVGFLIRRDSTIVEKYVYATNTTIKGHDENGQDNRRTIVLSGVFEY